MNFVLLFAAALILHQTTTEIAVAWVALVVAILVAQSAAFQVSRWDPVQPSAASPPAPPPAG